MADIHRFDKSKRQRFKSDILMPKIHGMMQRTLQHQIERKQGSRFVFIVIALAFCMFFMVLFLPI